MDDPRERRLAELANIDALAKEREGLILELAAEHEGEHGYRARLAKLAGLTRGRITQILAKASFNP